MSRLALAVVCLFASFDAYADEMFSRQEIAKLMHFSNSGACVGGPENVGVCEYKSDDGKEGYKISIFRIPGMPERRKLLLIVRISRLCGSAGCESIVITREGNRFFRVKEAFGITESAAIALGPTAKVPAAGPIDQSSTAQQPQGRKKDFAGIGIGMAWHDAVVVAQKLSCNPIQLEPNSVMNLKCSNGRYTISVATNMRPPRISGISFRFCSGQAEEEAARQYFPMFGLTSHNYFRTYTKLDETSTISFSMARNDSACVVNGIQVNTYSISIDDQKIKFDDSQALATRQKAVQPPKF